MRLEVERATRLGKRLIPIELILAGKQPVAEAEVPEKLRRLNYIFFREGQSSFNAPRGTGDRAQAGYRMDSRAHATRPYVGTSEAGRAATRTICCCAQKT
jgi:hypothetical protein